MKIRRSSSVPEKGSALLKLLVVMAVVAVVAGLTSGGFRYGPSAEYNRTAAAYVIIKSALEQYHEKHGKYPAPAHPGSTIKISGQDLRAGGARMLYQILTGDGDNEIQSTSVTKGSSDGKLNEQESDRGMNPNIPNKMVARDAGGYYLVDGWGRPFQYIVGGSEQSLNATYDLWSFGKAGSKGPFFYDAASRRNEEATATWIKNW